MAASPRNGNTICYCSRALRKCNVKRMCMSCFETPSGKNEGCAYVDTSQSAFLVCFACFDADDAVEEKDGDEKTQDQGLTEPASLAFKKIVFSLSRIS